MDYRNKRESVLVRQSDLWGDRPEVDPAVQRILEVAASRTVVEFCGDEASRVLSMLGLEVAP